MAVLVWLARPPTSTTGSSTSSVEVGGLASQTSTATQIPGQIKCMRKVNQAFLSPPQTPTSSVEVGGLASQTMALHVQ